MCVLCQDFDSNADSGSFPVVGRLLHAVLRFRQGNILEVAKSKSKGRVKKVHSNAKFEHAIKQVLVLNMQDANAHERPISLWGNEVGFGVITSCFRDLLHRPLVFSSPPWFALDQSDNSFNLERE